jgi:hypothetical protein
VLKSSVNLPSLRWHTWLPVHYNYVVDEKNRVLNSRTKNAVKIIQAWHKFSSRLFRQQMERVSRVPLHRCVRLRTWP